jgi:dUTP pyrophosphatase
VLKIELLHPDAKVPTRANATDAGLDLYSLEEAFIYSGSTMVIGTGIAMSIPTGYAGVIHPRSGLAIKQGIDKLAGLIDSSYRGEIRVALTTHNIAGYLRIKPGDRIAQLVIQKVELWTPQVVDELDETERGENGFGSSGS